MAKKKTVRKNDKVREQYEEYPYPYRDPNDEKKRLVTGSPSLLPELTHYLFKGDLSPTKTFRVLVAGGGTGDGLIMIAQEMADAGMAAEIHYLDLSEAARRVAEKRAVVRKLKNIAFHTGSLLQAEELGEFDYIDCCGVLHHLPNPGAGFLALKKLLKPEGGMGIMVYGELGRTGVYHVQDMLKMIASEGDAADRIKITKQLIGELPETNWLNRNSQLQDHKQADANLFDLLLHSQDRAYTVSQLVEVTAAAGLKIVSFVEPARYDPTFMIESSALRDRIDALSYIEKAAFAELLSGNIRKHVVYLTHEGREESTIADCHNAQAVPAFKDEQTQSMLQEMLPGTQPNMEADGLSVHLPLPPQTAVILGAVDGKRTLDQIRQLLPNQPDWFVFSATFQQIFKLLNGVGMMFLCRIKS
jgi:2-polyprenyl-3-methyl-5-hydroxy-6-metoxy-1,4-benzoquinol methylase